MLLENVVQQSTVQLLPATPALPLFIQTAYSGFHKLHGYWHWYRQGKTYLNPDNFLKLFSGHTLNFLVGDNRFVRLAAQCVMVSNSILACVNEQADLNRSYRKLVNALFQRHPAITIHSWYKIPISRFISPSTSQRVYRWLFDLDNYFRTVAFCIASFAKHFFKLSMATLDAIDAFSQNPENGNRAVNEFFVNGNNCLDAIANNREALIEKLNDNKEVIDCVLKTIGTSSTAEQFIEYVDNAVAKTETASNLLQNVNQFVGHTVSETLKAFFCLGMNLVGAGESVPDGLVPSFGALIFDKDLVEGEERYAPVCRLDRKNQKFVTESKFTNATYIKKRPNSLNEAYTQAKTRQMNSQAALGVGQKSLKI